MALSNARLKAALDAGLSTTTHIVWFKGAAGSEVEATEVARTAATFAAASTADPSVAQLSAAIESAAASAGVTITARAGAASGTASANDLTTSIVRLAAPVVLGAGGKITMAAADCTESINADDTYV